MKGMFVNDSGPVKFARKIVDAEKIAETRSRNMLSALVGERVAVVQTGRGAPLVIGSVTVTGSWFCPAEEFGKHYAEHLVPAGSKYDGSSRGKWFYYLADPVAVDPFPLPPSAIRHGRSWCEF